ncbi:DUF922 domain-containing protein [Pseudomonas tritici]|uniref:DUF922 domain-containing protein n=1 Tax=Pseudomonas tritici TaxID=2745518 RepID=UPI00387B7287
MSVNAQPMPTINFNVQHYRVTGSTSMAIRASVFDNTPVKMQGGRYGAVTRNEFNTGYSVVATYLGGCEVRNARVVLNSTVVLPQLVRDGQSAVVMAEWERYLGALRAHEQMHANNGKHTAETVLGRLYNFKANMSCPDMRAKLDAAVGLLIQNMGEWDRRLDAQTEHGKTQGAYLRPDFR